LKKVLLITMILLAPFETMSLMSSDSHSIRSFQFTYEVAVESTGGKKLELWMPVPQSNEVQTISDLHISTSGLPYGIKEEKVHGNKYLYVYNVEGTNERTLVSMTFNVSRKEHSNEIYKNVDPNHYIGAYSTVPTGNAFLSLIKEEKLSKNDVRGIYNYVLSGMHYGKPKSVDDLYYKTPWLNPDSIYGQKGVSRDEVVALYQKAKTDDGNYTFGNGNSIYACNIGVGNCTDYHSYFMSLVRTLEIPVRFHMGFPIPTGKEGPVGGYHCWADYYVEGKGWHPVDISEADKDPSKTDYFFGTVDNNRVDMMVGRDFVLDGYEEGKVNLFIYPLMEIGDKKSTVFTKSFSYKNL